MGVNNGARFFISKRGSVSERTSEAIHLELPLVTEKLFASFSVLASSSNSMPLTVGSEK